MGKLITPVQHELVLDGLNELRPLSRRKDIEQVISLPVLNQEPTNFCNRARGKVLRCSQQGAILGTQNRYYDNYEEIEKLHISGYNPYILTFSRIVKFVQVEIREISVDGYLWWRTLAPQYVIIEYTSTGFYYWPYRGTKLNVRISAYGDGSTHIFFRGFY